MEVVKLDLEQFRALVSEASKEQLCDLEEDLVLALGATEDSIRALNTKLSLTDSAAEIGLLPREEAHAERVEILRQITRALAAKNWYREKLSLVRRAKRAKAI